MTTGEDPFVVVGQRGTERVRYTAASAVAAAAVAEYLRTGVTVCMPEMRRPCTGCLTHLSEIGGSG